FYPAVAGAGTWEITYTYTDGNGCTNFATQFITVNALPGVTLDQLFAVCVNAEPVVLMGYPEGGVYSGAGVEGNLFSPAAAGVGTWEITYTYNDGNGCSNFATQSITVNALPTLIAEASATEVCLGESVTFTNYFTGVAPWTVEIMIDGVAEYFTTSDNPQTFTHTFTEPMEYVYQLISVTDGNGCTGEVGQTINITVNPLPTYVGEVSANEVCSGGSITFTNHVTGTSPWTVEFLSNGVPETMTIYEDLSTYTQVFTSSHVFQLVSVTDGNGCTTALDQTIIITVFELPTYTYELSATEICAGESITYINHFTGVAPWTVQFNENGIPMSFTTSDNPEYYTEVPTESFEYQPVSVTDGNGCTSAVDQTTFVTVNPLPTFIGEASASIVCSGESVTFTNHVTGTAPWTVEFLNNGVASTFTINEDLSTYTQVFTASTVFQFVSVTDGNGCTNALDQTIEITVNELPTLIAEVSPTEVCAGGSVTFTNHFTGVAPWTVEILVNGVAESFTTSDNPKTFTYTYTEPLVYVYQLISVTDGNGCYSTLDQTLTVTVNALPEVTLDPLAAVCIDAEPVVLMGAPEGGIYSGTSVNGNLFYPAVAGIGSWEITYTYTDGNGCTNFATQTITVNALPVVTLDPLADICLNAQPVALTGYPEGGVYSGTGVVGNLFVPANAGAGTWEITYTYTDSNGCSNFATQSIVVNPLTEIVSSPVNATLNEGLNAEFHVAAVNATSIQWQVSTNGTTWTDLANDALYSGVYTNDLLITGVTYSMNGYQYRAIASGICPPPAISGVAVLTVFPNITTTVNSVEQCAGDVYVNVTVTQLYGVASMSLTLNYDNTVLEFTGYDYLNPQFNTGFFDINAFNSQVKIGWFSLTPANVGDGLILAIKFHSNGGTSALTWDNNVYGNCDYRTIDNNPLASYYVNGVAVIYPLPVVTLDPLVDVCIDAQPVVLNGLPTMGIYSGVGVVDNMFYPAIAGIGTFTITYTYTDGMGCTNVATQDITVNELPVVTLNPLAPICVNAEPVVLNGLPVGGIYTGDGVNGNTFNPAIAGVGIHTITYTYADANGCSNFATQTITVNEQPEVILGPLAPVCIDAQPVTLMGYPEGGVFSGAGVSGSFFFPANAGAGTWEITYTYTDGNGCTNFATQFITVNPLPVVTLEPLATVCIDAQPVTLMGAPAGGIYTGDGVIGNVFYPAIAGAGTFTITYTYTDGNSCTSFATQSITVNTLPEVIPYTNGNNCTNFATQTITVNALPEVTLHPLSDVCIDAQPVILIGLPAGGLFSGTGVEGDIFKPSVAGVGTFEITYTYTDINGCTNFATQFITVNPLPVVTLEPLANVCIDAQPVTLMGAPAGGVYFGDGVNGNMFYPASAGAGTHTITYTFTDGNNCTNYATQTITVYALPMVTFQPLAAVCIDAQPVALIGYPEGGSFNGTGVVGNMFYPAVAGVGTFEIIYTYTNENGCTSFATQFITVYELPAVEFAPVAPLCVNAQAVTLYGLPQGGVFSGTGVTGNVFDPALAGVGTFILTYTYTNGNNCTNFATQTVTVNPVTPVTLDPIPDVCFDANPVTLNGQPQGGVYSGTGVIGNIFVPATAGVGTHVITYTLTNQYGCTTSTSQTVTVHALPVVSFAHLDDVCSDAGPVALIGQPVGGIFSGIGVMNNMFYPIEAGVGTFTLLYTYTNEFGCTSSASQTIVVNLLPTVYNVIGGGQYCAGGTGLPIGIENTQLGITYQLYLDGVFTGQTLAGNGQESYFLSLALQPGTYTVYAVNEGTNCSNWMNGSAVVVINPTLNAYAGGIQTICQGNSITLPASITGGTPPYSITWTPANTLNNPSIQNPVASPLFTTYYTIQVTDINGCMDNDNALVIVKPKPVVNAGLDKVILLGGSVQMTATVTGGQAPFTYTWTPVTGLNNANILNPIASPTVTTTYTLHVTSAFGCSVSDQVVITVNTVPSGYNITGTVTYDALQTTQYPLENTTVTLTPTNSTTLTDISGLYGFNVANGTYTTNGSSTKTWAGGNSIDALRISRHFQNLQMLTGLRLQAADVDGNGVVNANDALLVMMRSVQMINSFPAVGDWIFETKTVTVNNSDVVNNFFGLCYGDVDGSRPSYAKVNPNVTLDITGVQAISSLSQFTLPIRVGRTMTLGAASLAFDIPEGLEIMNVIANNGDKNAHLVYNVINGKLYIEWYSLHEVALNAGDALFTMTLRSTASARTDEFVFNVVGQSEMGDPSARVIDNALITIPKVKLVETGFGLGNNYPNPFSNVTDLSYTLPETGKVILTVFNAMGDVVAELVNAEQTAGNYVVRFDGSTLPQGVYIYRINFTGAAGSYQATNRMVISR
ncbi:MAG: T9SS type A sorting domain-containing protein, partial [Bacteroidetes bacterium]|nr:T9SS type A sorting domain-containing protein [Bacteroidota bacterium]